MLEEKEPTETSLATTEEDNESEKEIPIGNH